MNNLRTIGQALSTYSTTHDGSLPTAGAPAVQNGGENGLYRTPRTKVETIDSENGEVTIVPAQGAPQTWSWMYQILPYLELQNRFDNPNDADVVASHVSFFRCPGRGNDSFLTDPWGETAGPCDFVGNGGSETDLNNPYDPGADGAFKLVLRSLGSGDFEPALRPVNITSISDGTSNTILVAEKRYLRSNTPCNNWMGWTAGRPANTGGVIMGADTLFSGRDGGPAPDVRNRNTQCTTQAGLPHDGTANLLFFDGSVRSTNGSVDEDVWRALLSTNGGEDVDSENFVMAGSF